MKEESEVENDDEDSHYRVNLSQSSAEKKLNETPSSSINITNKYSIEESTSATRHAETKKGSLETKMSISSPPSPRVTISPKTKKKSDPKTPPNKITSQNIEKIESDEGPSSSQVTRHASHEPLTSISSLPERALPASSKVDGVKCRRGRHHLPSGLPKFRDPRASMWTTTHDANAPSEDRYASLVNVILRPPPDPNPSGSPSETDRMSECNISCGSVSADEETQVLPGPLEGQENTSLIRVSFWTVIDGHGGGNVANYASEVLVPHIAASIARELKCAILDRGVFHVNGQMRDANALDLDGLIRSSDRNQCNFRESGMDVVNPNAIHYRSPSDDSESEEECNADSTLLETSVDHARSASSIETDPQISVASSVLPQEPSHECASSVKTSVKTAVSPAVRHAPVGTHSPAEVTAITRAITNSFLAVDEGWINSIDPVTTHQTSCISNGRWNAGACALVVFTIQRLDWTRSSMVDPETEYGERGGADGEDTSHNKDAARRRKLDYATKSKSVSSLSDQSSTSSLTTVAAATTASVQESEITETEDEYDDISDIFGHRRLKRLGSRNEMHQQRDVLIDTPGGYNCHYYRPHEAMLYTAHVGDCRAVMLGSAPPRTIKVHPKGESSEDHSETSDDCLSNDSSFDESEGYSSREGDSDSSDNDEMNIIGGSETKPSGSPLSSKNGRYMSYRHRAGKRQRVSSEKSTNNTNLNTTRRFCADSEESELESDDSSATTALEPDERDVVRNNSRRSYDETKICEPDTTLSSVSPAQDHRFPPPLPLSSLMRPIDLTTDHSAYNPAEVTAVLRRCNNAPKAISAAAGGGIKRVAGSLAVTRGK